MNKQRTQVNARLGEAMLSRLESHANRVGLSVSEVVRVAVSEYLDNHERSLTMKEMLVGWTVNGLRVTVGAARPGQEPGETEAGTVVKVVGIPDGITTSEVIRAVEVTSIYLPHGPFEVPWDMLGDGKIVTAERLGNRNEGPH